MNYICERSQHEVPGAGTLCMNYFLTTNLLPRHKKTVEQPFLISCPSLHSFKREAQAKVITVYRNVYNVLNI